MVSQRTLKDVVEFIEREIRRKREDVEEKEESANEYRNMIIKCGEEVTRAFPESIPNILSALLSSFLSLSDKAVPTALASVLFVREVIEQHPTYRQEILGSLCSNFSSIVSPLVLRIVLWVLGEYAQT